MNAADFFSIPDSTVQNLRFQLGNRQVYEESVEKSITMEEFGEVMFKTAKDAMVDGSNSIFPPIDVSTPGTFDLDTMENFDWVEVSSGIISLTVENNFPVDIAQLQINIRNVSDDAVVGAFNFTNIASGSTATRTDDLTNDRIENNTYIEILSFNTPGSAPSTVPINFSDDLMLTLEILDTRVIRGRAILPEQEFDSDSTLISMDVVQGERLDELKLSSGRLNYQLQSYIEEDIELNIILPNTTVGGFTVTKSILVNAMDEGPTIGYVDLTNSITIMEDNSVPAIYLTKLVSSGRMVNFDFSDTINYLSQIERTDITIDYAIGYFGSDTIDIGVETIENDNTIFSNVIGSFELTNPEINIKYTNSYGIPLNLNLDFAGEYLNSGNTVNMSTPNLTFNQPATILDSALQGVITYNRQNLPEITDFLQFPLSDILSYSGQSVSNPSGDTTAINFVHGSSEITIGLEIKLPLEIRSDSVTLSDTIKFESFSNNEESSTDSEEGSFNIDISEASLAYKLKNGFPLELDFIAILYDSISDTRYDTIDIGHINGAPVDSRGIVIAEQIVESSGIITINESFIDNLQNNTNKLILVGKMATSKDNTGNSLPVKILTTCNIDFHAGLVAKISIKNTPKDE